MQLPIYQIDAFSDKAFAGNPAAVVPLETWLDEKVMQAVAAENNLAETAFFVAEGETFRIRWFTPTVEVDLCGHATLASAYVLFNELNHQGGEVLFVSRSGPLSVTRDGALLTLNFPVQKPEPCACPALLLEAFGKEPRACLFNVDFVLVYDNEEYIRDISPKHELIRQADARGVIVTAPGREVDFVARFFASGSGIQEDPVTGSAYTKLVPYWSERLGVNSFSARQLSSRGGELQLKLEGERVLISGKALKYMQGTIYI